MFKTVTFTRDTEMAQSATQAIARVDPFRVIDNQHKLLADDGTWFYAPADFSLSYDFEGDAQVVWNRALALPAGHYLLGIAYLDSLTGASVTADSDVGDATAANQIAAKDVLDDILEVLNTQGATLAEVAANTDRTADGMEDEDPVPISVSGTANVSFNGTAQPVYDEGTVAVLIPVSQTDSAVGNANDRLAGLLIIPGDTSPAGNVVVKDGSTTVFTWPAHTLVDISVIPVPMFNAKATTGWLITTPADVTVVVFYLAK